MTTRTAIISFRDQHLAWRHVESHEGRRSCHLKDVEGLVLYYNAFLDRVSQHHVPSDAYLGLPYSSN